MKAKDVLIMAHKKSRRGIHLVASENVMPLDATLPYLTNVFNRYVYDIDKKDGKEKEDLAAQLPGFTNIDELNLLEEECNHKLCEMLGARYSNVKAISGLNMIISVVGSLVLKNEVVLSLPINAGGHAATKYLVERLGIEHHFLPVKLVGEEIDIDYEKLCSLIQKIKIKLIYIDLMNVIYTINIRRLRQIIGSGTIICFDASHVLGIIMGGRFQNPLQEGADILVGSTHKSFPGPHKGVFVTNRKWYKMLYEINSDLFISHTHIADIISLSIVLDKGKAYFEKYAQTIQENVKLFVETLKKRKITAYAGVSHQVWIDCNGIDVPRVIAKCKELEIYLNQIELPFYGNVGLRIGLQEITYQQFASDDIIQLANVIAAILQNVPISKEVRVWLAKRRKKKKRGYRIEKIKFLAHIIRNI